MVEENPPFLWHRRGHGARWRIFRECRVAASSPCWYGSSSAGRLSPSWDLLECLLGLDYVHCTSRCSIAKGTAMGISIGSETFPPRRDHFPRLLIPACSVDGVPKEAISRHLTPNHSRHHRTRVDPDPKVSRDPFWKCDQRSDVWDCMSKLPAKSTYVEIIYLKSNFSKGLQ